MNGEYYPAPWDIPELPGLHCAKCASTVNLGCLDAIGVSRERQVTYAQQFLADNHLRSPMWSLSCAGTVEVPEALQSTDTVA